MATLRCSQVDGGRGFPETDPFGWSGNAGGRLAPEVAVLVWAFARLEAVDGQLAEVLAGRALQRAVLAQCRPGPRVLS